MSGRALGVRVLAALAALAAGACEAYTTALCAACAGSCPAGLTCAGGLCVSEVERCALGPAAGGAEYPDVVPACAPGWRRVLDEPFDEPLAARWTWPGTGPTWHLAEGAAEVDLTGAGDYWTTHLLSRGPELADLWVRVDVTAPAIDTFPQLHLRVDPTRPAERFYAVRLATGLDGLLLVRQSGAENDFDEEVGSAFAALTPGATYRWVAAVSGGTAAGEVTVRAALYDLAGAAPAFVPGSRVEHTYRGESLYERGLLALGGWSGVLRFDALEAWSCP